MDRSGAVVPEKPRRRQEQSVWTTGGHPQRHMRAAPCVALSYPWNRIARGPQAGTPGVRGAGDGAGAVPRRAAKLGKVWSTNPVRSG